MSTGEIAWRPTREAAERTRIAHLGRTLGCASLADLQRRALEDPEGYWRAVVRDLGVRWSRPFTRVLDESRGIAWPRWFPDGRLNFAESCLDRHVEEGRGDAPAVIAESDAGAVRTTSYRDLLGQVGRFANALRRLGVGKGDRVGVLLPMSAEAVIALLATARLGAIAVPCFSGFGAGAVAQRLSDAEAKLLVTTDGFTRRGRAVATKEIADEALAEAPSVEHVIVARRLGGNAPLDPRRDRDWDEVCAAESDRCEPVPMEADDPYLLIYTSGTTGKPKGTVLTQGGFLVKTGHDFAYLFDVGRGDRLFWLTDLGWLMGPMAITAALLHGATLVAFDGTPDYPGPDRLWALAARHRVSVLGLSPTAVRALIPHGAAHVRAHDLSALRILGSTGEPWNPEPWRWLFEEVGQRRIPIVNYTGGTEISGGILGCFPNAPIKPCAFFGPIPGMAADVYGDDGRPVRGEVGELVVTRPWPGMTRGFWRDPERYEETYWSRWPNVWVHGDWALVDSDGFWFLQGRSDDTLKIAGKRLGPAEVESALADHPAVAESGVVGVPHEVKGEAIVCFVVLRAGNAPTDALRGELADLVATRLGRPLKPERILFTRELPKTRSAKIMRRVIRAVHLRREPGDLSSLENPDSVRAISEAS